MSQALSERYTRILIAELRDGRDMAQALRQITLEHANHLRQLGPIRVLALDPCPMCMGVVLADTEKAYCRCGWNYRPKEAAA